MNPKGKEGKLGGKPEGVSVGKLEERLEYRRKVRKPFLLVNGNVKVFIGRVKKALINNRTYITK
jgi:hypothetical protein